MLMILKYFERHRTIRSKLTIFVKFANLEKSTVKKLRALFSSQLQFDVRSLSRISCQKIIVFKTLHTIEFETYSIPY